LKLIKDPVIYKRDIVKSSLGYFNYVAALGNYVDISYKTDPKMKRIWGFLAYIVYGVKAFFVNPKIKAKIEIEGKTIEGNFSLLMITKSQYIAGFNLNKEVLLDDGLLTFWALPYSPILNNVYFLMFFIFKWKKIKGLVELKAASIKIHTESKRVWSLDGEAKIGGNLEANVLKQKLPVIINPKVSHLFKNA
jgi:diacylglycerol kinase (ATP)